MKWLAAAAATLLVAGCTRVSSDAGPPRAQLKILRVVGAQELDTLNPLLTVQQYSVDCSMFWAGYFFNLNDKGQLEPELAAAVPTLENGGISKDGLTITYHLRRGVKWQDGAPFTARDVQFTWQAIMNPSNNATSRNGYDRVRSVEIIDDYTVRFHLKTPYAPAVNTFFAPSAGPVAILPAHLLAKYHDLNRVPYNVKPIGTGPFVVDRWEQGTGVTMHANPNYWRGRPTLDGVDFMTVHDNNTMLIMMRSGEADLYYNVPDSQYQEAGAVSGARVVVTPFIAYQMLLFNTVHPPLDDLKVRQAISYGVDKGRVVQDITHGSGTIATGDQPPLLWANNPNVPTYGGDPTRARALLDADGWRPGPDGVRMRRSQRLEISISTPAGYRDGAQFEGLFQQWMREIGVQVDVKNYPTSLLYSSYGGGGILATGKYDTAFVEWFNGIDPDDSIQWTCFYRPPEGQNFAYWCDRRFDAAERIALSTYDQAARKRAYAEVQAEMAKELPADFLYFLGRTDLVSNRLRNYRPSPAVSTFWNTWEFDLN